MLQKRYVLFSGGGLVVVSFKGLDCLAVNNISRVLDVPGSPRPRWFQFRGISEQVSRIST